MPEKLRGTPFEYGVNAAAVAKLERGEVVRRTSGEGTLTPDDRFRFRALGLPHTHAAAVVLHKILRTDGPRQLARLRTLFHSLDRLVPSEACDAIAVTGDATGICSGQVDGPLGKVAVRVPMTATLVESPAGAISFGLSNHRAMEAKAVFGWSDVVAPGRLKVAYDMFPVADGWLVYVRVGVEMSAHEGSAKTVTDSMLKLEAWLTHELSTS